MEILAIIFHHENKIHLFSDRVQENNLFHILKHRCEAVLRKHLRSFENQIRNIIRRTKGKRSMLKFHQLYSAKKYPKGWA